MAHKTLIDFNTAYEGILHSNLSSRDKTLKYSELMTEMEQVFNIPIVKDDEYEQANRAVIALYRKISMSRSL